MPKYIDAEDFFDVFPEIDKIPYSSWAVTHIADVRPNIKGKWVRNKANVWDVCNRCGDDGSPGWNFCPNCGADMRGDTD